MQSGKAVTSTRKVALADQQILATGYVKTNWATKLTAGQTTINLTALNTPTEMTGNGFVQPTSAQISSASLLFYPANLTLTSSAKGLLIRGLSYVISGSTTITLLYNGLEGEILSGTIDYTAVNGNLVVPATSQPATGTLAAGQNLFNIGTPYPTNKYPTTNLGAVLVFRDGAMQMRNTGNSSSVQDGAYYEVDNGGGQFSTIMFNYTDPDQASTVLCIPNGLQVAQPNGSIQAVVESLAGQVTQMAQYVAALASTTPQTILGAAPTNVDLTTFGNTVIALQASSANITKSNAWTAYQSIPGRTDGSSSPTGDIGEYQESNISRASSTTLTSGTGVSIGNITSFTIPAGDWDVWGLSAIYSTGSGTAQYVQTGISSVSATLPADGSHGYNSLVIGSGSSIDYGTSDYVTTIPPQKISLSVPTTYYLVIRTNVLALTGNIKVYGTISVRRRS